jgi:hypothetical protein
MLRYKTMEKWDAVFMSGWTVTSILYNLACKGVQIYPHIHLLLRWQKGDQSLGGISVSER